MTESNEISVERLADWLEGRLSEEEAEVVAEQVARTDEATRAQLEWLRAFVRASATTNLVPPPREVRRAISRRFAAHAKGQRRPGLLQRLVATLSLDSGLQSEFGLRSSDSEESQRQLVYATDAADIILNIRTHHRNGRLDLDGQVFPGDDADLASFSVQLLSGTDEVGMTVTDELGEFTFESISPGGYQILVSSDRVEILISPVELRP
jgi:hypothetical protein